MKSMRTGEGQDLAVGFDFGTTNSSVAIVDGNEPVQLATFRSAGAETQSFRSVLYFEQYKNSEGIKRTHSLTGPAAIEHYLQTDEKGRLVQSLKSHLSSRTLTGTEVFGRRYKLEELISRMLSDIRKHTGSQIGRPIRYAMVGRPVRFVGAETEDDQEFSVTRLRAAFALAGFEHVDFEMEPVAAAYTYEATLGHEELILIGDFGGGTSDFSLLRVGPRCGVAGRTPADLLGNSGVAWPAMHLMRELFASWFAGPRIGRRLDLSTNSCRPCRRGSTRILSAGTISRSCAPTTSVRF